MANRIIEINNRPMDEGSTFTVDHFVQSFNIVVRSNGGLSPETIKQLLQKKWEVIRVDSVDSTVYVHAAECRDF